MKFRPAYFLSLMMLLSCVALTSCDTTSPGPVDVPGLPPGPRPDPKPDPEVRLAPGDALEVFVKEDTSFNKLYKVRTRGDIILPQSLERVVVEGMTDREAAAAIKKALENGLLTTATVDVDIPYKPKPDGGPKPPKGKMISIVLNGMVRNRGRHTVVYTDIPPRAYQVLVDAGGTVPFASLKKAKIRRMASDGRYQIISADMEAIRDGEAPDIPLMNNDIIDIPEKWAGRG